MNIGALPRRWICWDRISASDWPPASAKLKRRNTDTLKCLRNFKGGHNTFESISVIHVIYENLHTNYRVLLLLLLLLSEYVLFPLIICFSFTFTWILRNISDTANRKISALQILHKIRLLLP